MDSSEFPSLSDSTSSNVDKSTLLGSSWAEVAQPHPSEEANASSDDNKENKQPVVDHRPGVWETTKQSASFADIAGHEKKQAEEFPTPQESLDKTETASLPASGGVGDLLHSNNAVTEDTTQPPNPDRSFADVTSNKDYPTPEHDDTQSTSELPPLSKLPDVKDMLEKPSVHVPPVPPAQSFAKMAAKEIPPEKRPLSERAQYIINNQPVEDPMALNDDNFPTLGQSNLMAEEHASMDDKSMYSEISRFNQVNDDETKAAKVDPSLTKSFADITGSNLENAPPSAVSRVDQHPVYNEELVYKEAEKREERKHDQVEYGNNEQLLKEEKEIDNLPEEILEEVLEEEHKVTEKSRGMNKGGADENALAVRLHTFDQESTGVITIFDTITALYRLGYSWFTILPGAIFMHLRLSPMTSPHRFPFIYRSLSDLILLPIYTRNLNNALSYKTPMLHQGKEEVNKMVETYGHKTGSSRGLGYWDGLRAMRNLEQTSLRWWQFGLWTVHRVQWTLTYTMLHEPKSNVVTAPTLISLSSSD
ncbi:unnamed protein product [Mucor hiemalis]